MKHESMRVCRFSMIEMLVVLAILLMIVGLAGPLVIGHLEKGKQRTAASQVMLLKSCVKSYYIDTGEYPDSLDDLVEKPADVEKWSGPYIEDGVIPLDPWDNDYHYEKPGPDGQDFAILSYGRDKAPGGEDVDADILSWTPRD